MEERPDVMSAYVDGKIYVIEGYQNQNYMASGESYYKSSVWKSLEAL